MVCVSCGANLPSNPYFCPQCHAATAALGPHFLQAEKRLALLRHRYQSGELDSATFTQEVQKLIVKDEDGRLWWLGDQPGEWHWHDGQQWLRGQPKLQTQTATNKPVSPDLASPTQRGGYKKWAIAGGFIIVLAAIALGAVWLLSNKTADDQPFLAIAYSENSPQSLTVYIGEPENHSFQLPPGDYYIEAVDGNSRVYEGWVEQITTLSDNDGIVEFDHLQTSNGDEDEVTAGQLNTLANFLMSVKLAELSYLNTFSDGFQAPLFKSESADLLPFLTSLEMLEGQETAVSPTLTAFSTRAEASLTAQTHSTQSSNVASLNGRIKSHHQAALRPTLGVWDSLTNIFTQCRDGRDQTREDILDAFEIMTPNQRQEAFDWLPDKQKGGAQNYEEFLEKLSSGRLNSEIHFIHTQLLQSQKDYETAIKTLHPDANRPGLEYYHEVGGQLVKLGAELEVEIIKTALLQRFPDMAQGFDYADQTNAWAEYVKNAYEHPILALEDAVGNTLKDSIRDRIEQDILSTFPGIDEEVATILADKMTTEVASVSSDLATRIAQGLTSDQPELDPDSEWIGEFVQSVTNQLLDEGEDPFSIAAQTEDLRDCLSAAVAEGLSKEEALVVCGVALDLLEDSNENEIETVEQNPEPQPDPEPEGTSTVPEVVTFDDLTLGISAKALDYYSMGSTAGGVTGSSPYFFIKTNACNLKVVVNTMPVGSIPATTTLAGLPIIFQQKFVDTADSDELWTIITEPFEMTINDIPSARLEAHLNKEDKVTYYQFTLMLTDTRAALVNGRMGGSCVDNPASIESLNELTNSITLDDPKPVCYVGQKPGSDPVEYEVGCDYPLLDITGPDALAEREFTEIVLGPATWGDCAEFMRNHDQERW